MCQGLTTNMLQVFGIQLKIWLWLDLNQFPNSSHSLLYLSRDRNHSQLPCWQLLLHKNKSRCWVNACSPLFKECILNSLERSQACCWRSTIRSWFTCWNTASPLRARWIGCRSTSSSSVQEQ